MDSQSPVVFRGCLMSSVSSAFRPILKLPVRQCRIFLVVSFGTDWQERLTAVQQVRQQQNRYDTNGVNNRMFAKRWLKGFYRPDRPKKAGAIAHPEAQTFDRKRMDGELGGRKSRHMPCKTTCPQYPRKRIFKCNSRCPLWAKSGHVRCKKRTSAVRKLMSALRQ